MPESVQSKSPSQPSLRFSLRTLLFAVLLIGGAAGLWLRWEPWAIEQTLAGKRPTYSLDGSRIVTVNEKAACIFDAATGLQIAELKGHHENPASATFSPDGKKAVSVSFDGTLRVWDAETGKELHREHTDSYYLECALFSPDGKYIVGGVNSNSLRVWDSTTFEPTHAAGGNPLYLSPMMFSKNGRWIAEGHWIPNAYVLDLKSGQQLARLVGHSAEVTTAVFLNDDHRVLTADDKDIRIWDAEQNMKQIFYVRGYLKAVSPNGEKFLASVSQRCHIFNSKDADHSLELAAPASEIEHAVFSPDGSRLATAGPRGGTIWNVDSGNRIQDFDAATRSKHPLAFASDGRHLAVEEKVLHRRRPEYWWGVIWLPEFWLTAVFAMALAWSVRRDRKRLSTR